MEDQAHIPLSESATASVFCPACSSPLVQALDWEQQSESCWHVRLWCPECGHEQSVTLERSHLSYLSLAIETGFVWVLEGLSELEAALSDPTDVDFAHRARTDRIPSVRH